jgi:hypothetical protein
MKKTTSTKKSVETKAPAAPVPAAAVVKKAAAAKAPAPAKPAAVKEKKPAAAPKARKPAAAPATPKKAAAPEALVTKVVALIDVGFGNSLTIRGEGPGLSWDSGVTMACADGTAWVWSTSEATGPVTFKVLVNDLNWCGGVDLVATPGSVLEFTPEF